MKRTGNLYGSICEPENLRLAFYKAAKGRQDRAEIIQYRSSLDLNLKLLHQQLVIIIFSVSETQSQDIFVLRLSQSEFYIMP